MFLLYLVAKDKKMLERKNIIIGGVVSLVAFIGYYLYKQSKLISSLCYDFSSTDFLGRDGTTSNLALNFEFSNYSDIPITITGYDINAFIDGRMVGKLINEEEFVIPAKGKAQVRFVAEADTQVALGQFLGSFLTQLIDQIQSVFTIKGNVSAKMGFIKVDNYPIEYTWNTDEIISDIKTSEKCSPIT